MSSLTRRQAALLLSGALPLTARIRARARVRRLSLQAAIEKEIQTTPALAAAYVGILAIRVSDGKVLYRQNQERLFVPASNAKLFTSALALLRLGPDYRFTTSIVAEGSFENGRLLGNLVMIGRGDPTLSNRAYPYTVDPSVDPSNAGPDPGPLRPVEALVDQLVQAGLHSVEGDIIGDDTRYPWAPYPGAWTSGDETWDYGAPVSAMVINDNRIAMRVGPGQNEGDAAEISFAPATDYFEVDNRIRTDSQPGKDIHVDRSPGSNQLKLWGRIGTSQAPALERLAVPEPALFGAAVLRGALLDRGIAVRGEPRARHRPAGDETPPGPAAGTELARRTSPPLLQILQVVDKVSQNLHAEILLREAGAVRQNKGTVAGGLAEMSDFLKAAGMPDDSVHLHDGSGLSRNTLVTPEAIVGLLLFLYRSRAREQFISLLPVGGEDGSLRLRFAGHAEARGLIAKTGSLSDVHALSGYAASKSNGIIAFSILVNNVSGEAAKINRFLDNIGLDLLR